MKSLKRYFDWYITKNALPYWQVLLVDCVICFLAGLIVCTLTYRDVLTTDKLPYVVKTLSLYMVVNIVSFKLFHTYSGIIRYSSFVDLIKVSKALSLACVCVIFVQHIIVIPNPDLFQSYLVPHSFRLIILIYTMSIVGMFFFRVIIKNLYEVLTSSNISVPTLVYGVKDGGIGIAKSIRSTDNSRFHLEGFIDPESNLVNKNLQGVKVYLSNQTLRNVIKHKNIEAILISPLQTNRFRNDSILQDIVLSMGVKVFMMQTMEVGNEHTYSLSKLKEIKIEDLLPRNEIVVNLDEINQMMHGKKILLTGSAGSIGSEILKQICQFYPSELILIDVAETPQHDIRLYIDEHFPDIKATTLVGSITNEKRMEKLFQRFSPDFVFHAAAYKHVPMMEDNPSESVRNNVYGTKVIADLSVKYGVKKFVMLSTDKAVNPTNVMGCSKRICEIYVQSLNRVSDTQFITTRFGNVLGSNGSVIPRFEHQIKTGGPVTVTDSNITRYFMLIPEACRLVLEAGTHGNGGEIYVFDMGKPYRIADLAKRMIWLSGKGDIKIEYTGLRPGEKIYEEVLAKDEDTLPSFHSKIRIAKVREYDYQVINNQIAELLTLAETYDAMAIVGKMKEIVPEFISNNSIYSVLDK